MRYLFFYNYDLLLNIKNKVYRVSLLILRLRMTFYLSVGIGSYCSSFVSLIYFIFLGYIIFVVVFLILIVSVIEEGGFVLVFDFSGLLVFKEDFFNR